MIADDGEEKKIAHILWSGKDEIIAKAQSLLNLYFF